jgi:ELWxxDGT repeat protein
MRSRLVSPLVWSILLLGCVSAPAGENDPAVEIASPSSNRDDPRSTFEPQAGDGEAFFQACDATHGCELWKSDGTHLGTVMVKDVNRGSGSSEPMGLIDVTGALFFLADDGIHGRELWMSDGTRRGTLMVKDIHPSWGQSKYRLAGDLCGQAADLGLLAAIGGTLYFTARDGIHGGELWKSDGTETGTVKVKDINPGLVSSLVDSGGTVFFAAVDGVHGSELWRSDGTETGTVMVKDINPGSMDGLWPPDDLTDLEGTLLFSANDDTQGEELWKSDGTEPGTVMVKDVAQRANSSFLRSLTDVGGSLFFLALDDDTVGWQLWKSDGTRSRTLLVTTNRWWGFYDHPDCLTDTGGKLFFSARDGLHGQELWKSDGTEAGTHLVADIYEGHRGSQLRDLTFVPK